MKKNKYTVGYFNLTVKKSNTGKGLFATNRIPKGSCIIEYIGTPVPRSEHEHASGKYLFWTGKHTMINGNIKENIARYINHSCKPNCEADGPEGRVFICAKKTIQPGEELTYNYGREYVNRYIKPIGCKCTACIRKLPAHS